MPPRWKRLEAPDCYVERKTKKKAEGTLSRKDKRMNHTANEFTLPTNSKFYQIHTANDFTPRPNHTCRICGILPDALLTPG
eukprot:1177533-Prorocentrum_minimum.AAC.4